MPVTPTRSTTPGAPTTTTTPCKPRSTGAWAGSNWESAYTWSKALGVSVGHINDTRKAGYGPLPQDRTQSLVVNYIYSIPSLRKGSFLDNAATRLVLNGWQLSGLTSVSSGAPVNVSYSRFRDRRHDAESHDHGKRGRRTARGLHLQSERITRRPEHRRVHQHVLLRSGAEGQLGLGFRLRPSAGPRAFRTGT